MPAESPTSNGKRPLQFTLRTLLLIVSSLAATLGAVHWLGAEVLLFILAAGGVWLTARTKARHLLVWLVPVLLTEIDRLLGSGKYIGGGVAVWPE